MSFFQQKSIRQCQFYGVYYFKFCNSNFSDLSFLLNKKYIGVYSSLVKTYYKPQEKRQISHISITRQVGIKFLIFVVLEILCKSKFNGHFALIPNRLNIHIYLHIIIFIVFYVICIIVYLKEKKFSINKLLFYRDVYCIRGQSKGYSLQTTFLCIYLITGDQNTTLNIIRPKMVYYFSF